MWDKILDNKPQDGFMLEANFNNTNVFVANIDGKLFCAKNNCPHEDVKLTLGCLKNKTIRCSLHGFIFDLVSGKSNEESVDNLNIYQVKESNNQVYIKN